MKTIFFILLAIATLPLAHADILFLDLHISNAELRAVKAAAAARGEKVIVYPDVTDADRRKIESLANIIMRIENRSLRREGRLTDEALQAEDKAQTDLKNITDRYPFTADDLKHELGKIEAAGTTITSFVVSGHSDGDSYWGYNPAIQATDIFSAFSEHPKVRDSIHGLYLWGCYSAVLDKVYLWKGNFPKAGMILGYDDAAPLAQTEADPALLKDALIKESAIAKQHDAKAISAAFRQLTDVSATNAVLETNSCYVGTHTAAKDLSKTMKDCAENANRLLTLQKSFTNYFRADPPFENPPADPHHSELRTYYSELQRLRFCEFPQMEPNEEILTLIFFDNVRKNFGRLYLDQIATANNLLKKHGAPADVLFPDLYKGKLTRHEFMEHRKRLIDYLAPARTSTEASDWIKEVDKVLTPYMHLWTLNCIPMSWVTESPTDNQIPEAPSC